MASTLTIYFLGILICLVSHNVISAKSEGAIPIEEFKLSNEIDGMKVGSKVKILLERLGRIIISAYIQGGLSDQIIRNPNYASPKPTSPPPDFQSVKLLLRVLYS